MVMFVEMCVFLSISSFDSCPCGPFWTTPANSDLRWTFIQLDLPSSQGQVLEIGLSCDCIVRPWGKGTREVKKNHAVFWLWPHGGEAALTHCRSDSKHITSSQKQWWIVMAPRECSKDRWMLWSREGGNSPGFPNISQHSVVCLWQRRKIWEGRSSVLISVFYLELLKYWSSSFFLFMYLFI